MKKYQFINFIIICVIFLASILTAEDSPLGVIKESNRLGLMNRLPMIISDPIGINAHSPEHQAIIETTSSFILFNSDFMSQKQKSFRVIPIP